MIAIEQNPLAKVLYYYGLLEGDDTFKIICPFHNDINASLQVTLSKNFFYCHGCNVHGDAMEFVRLVNKDKMDDLQACIEYYKILHSKKVKHLKIKPRQAKVKDNTQALIEAEDYYFNLKTIDWTKIDCQEKEYMLQRGFTAETLNKCKAKLTYTDNYPIIFPMFDNGEFKGWVCRTTNKVTSSYGLPNSLEKKRKYLYNTGFSRRNTLVGDYGGKMAILVEGYIDRLKFIQFGVNKAVAILGWKITAQQIAKLKEKGIKYIISALDNDACGKKGTEYLQKYFKVIRFQYPKGVKDPGEMDYKIFKKALEKTKKLYKEVLKNEFS